MSPARAWAGQLGGAVSLVMPPAKLVRRRRRIAWIDLERFVELRVEHYRVIDDARRQLLPLRSVLYLNVAT
jgi:hypothetical protein